MQRCVTHLADLRTGRLIEPIHLKGTEMNLDRASHLAGLTTLTSGHRDLHLGRTRGVQVFAKWLRHECAAEANRSRQAWVWQKWDILGNLDVI